MALAYELSRVNPWLSVVLLAVVMVGVLALAVYALYQLRRLKKGFGRVLYLAQVYPRAGLAVAVEFCVWGVGWLAWQTWGRGALMLALWAVWVALFLSVPAAVGALFMVFPPLSPVAATFSALILLAVFVSVGFNSAQALLKVVEKEAVPAKSQQAGQAA
jgi:hypothetical protein